MFFKSKDLCCSNCNKYLGEGETIFVTITLPSQKKMYVGVLDKVLQKHSQYVYCECCNFNKKC
ncbi:hypothetical protein ABB10_26895 [Bacillus thuringiensis]|uniref:Uncharacterized protein n=1 Tax=Bacillus thuringiensis DB27 TaxID=1431339 RepID=W8YT51_BACTU|nr:hypothetical protein [Bacillus thuringiensis]MBG9668065.1 hypothetical protein [Bacillus thuringiensis]MBH0355683.1 hypothetical protein [Bacillus thuringiensis]PHG67353.1 hypothetical protein COI59_11655 [Bacillus toyonensis]CDN33805.1 unnamed protein product [Bacillus thuringiensis DB27]